MKAKYVLLLGALGVAGIAAFAVKKALTLKSVFEQMKIYPSGISNFKISLTDISFNLDFNISNPTSEAFSLTGASMVILKRISVYRNGQFFGTAEVNMGALEIPANSTVTIENLPFSVALQTLLENISTISTLSIADLTIVGIVEVLGNDYVIEG